MYKTFMNTNLPGIPRAPTVKFYNVVQYNYEKNKSRYLNVIPFLSREEIIKYRNPETHLFQKLLADGYGDVVQEILTIKKEADDLEKSTIGPCGEPRPNSIRNFALVTKIAERLKLCLSQELKGFYMASAGLRFHFAEDQIVAGNFQLCKHFLLAALATTRFVPPEEAEEFQAMLHCYIAHINQKILGSHIEETINHLEKARNLARDNPWTFKNQSLKISVQKPISIYGLRDDWQVFPCNFLTVYKVASFLYFDLMSGMVTDTMKAHPSKTIEDFDIALDLCREVLGMAQETRNPIAIASALTRYGVLLRQSGDFDRAYAIFQQLEHESSLLEDFESLTIAYGNLAICCQGRRYPLKALTWFHTQSETARRRKLLDLKTDAIVRMAHVLLQEGQSLEAEQCIFEAYTDYVEENEKIEQENKDNGDKVNKSEPRKQKEEQLARFEDYSWAMTGIVTGQNLWGRYAGLCRITSDSGKAVESVLQWKEGRQPLRTVPSPNYESPEFYQVFDKVDPVKKIPEAPCHKYDCFKKLYRDFQGSNLALFETLTKSHASMGIDRARTHSRGKREAPESPNADKNKRVFITSVKGHKARSMGFASDGLLDVEEYENSFQSGYAWDEESDMTATHGHKKGLRINSNEESIGHSRDKKVTLDAEVKDYETYIQYSSTHGPLSAEQSFVYSSDFNSYNKSPGSPRVSARKSRRILNYALGTIRPSDVFITGNKVEYARSRTASIFTDVSKISANWLQSRRDNRGPTTMEERAKPINLSFGAPERTQRGTPNNTSTPHSQNRSYTSRSGLTWSSIHSRHSDSHHRHPSGNESTAHSSDRHRRTSSHLHALSAMTNRPLKPKTRKTKTGETDHTINTRTASQISL